jgi:aminopeptidase YwaD
MIRLLSIIAIILAGHTLSIAQTAITVKELRKHVEYLASDELEGRKPGTRGDELAAEYIRRSFVEAGLMLGAVNGLQPFSLVTGAKPGPANRMSLNGIQLLPDSQFIPFSFSANAPCSAEVVFAGYGIAVKNDTLDYDDYKGLNVKGKWVLLMRSDPMPDNANSAFAPYAEERSKVVKARDAGALGVLFVSGPSIEKEDRLGKMYFDKSSANAGLPVFQISRAVADRIIADSDHSIASLEAGIQKSLKPLSLSSTSRVDAQADVLLTEVKTWNIIALVNGSDPLLKDQYLVVGAHYDHLGMGGPGSGSRVIDTLAVHNGADDNASGVAGMLELAEYFQKNPTRRSIIFIAFGAEESGLIGSKHYAANPVSPLTGTMAMVNLDMVGRLRTDDPSIAISGTGTSLESEAILTKLSKKRSFKSVFNPEGFGASDHSSFYINNIPVFFFTTGAHDDYHKPADDAFLLNYKGQVAVMEMVADLIDELGNRDSLLTFKEAGPKFSSSRGRGNSITMGILPDFASQGNSGLRIDGVRQEGPAAKGGMLKGDIIVAIEGHPVTNIYDYMFRMKAFVKGQTVSVDVIRDGQRKVLIIQL